MDELAAVQTVLDIIERLEIPYMVVGSLSSNAYGVVRATQDADLVVVLKGDDLKKLNELLPPGFHLNPQAFFETVTGKTRHIIDIDDPVYTIELFELSDGEFDASRFGRRTLIELDDRPRHVQTAEDVVIQKLHWFHLAHRRKDHDDARDVISTQRSHLDWTYIRTWCQRLDLTGELEQMLATLPQVPPE